MTAHMLNFDQINQGDNLSRKGESIRNIVVYSAGGYEKDFREPLL